MKTILQRHEADAEKQTNAGEPGGKTRTMEKQTFDRAFEKAHVIDTGRTPAAIRADIAKQEGIQKEAIRCCMELTGDKRRRLKEPLKKPENMASDPAMIPVIAKHREKYGAAAVKIVELERELAVAEGARA